MGVAKKRLRKIVVDNEEYYWKFNEKVFIFKNLSKNNMIEVDFGWFDIYLERGRKFDFEHPITPKFISAAIQFAKENGWSSQKMKLNHKDGEFELFE